MVLLYSPVGPDGGRSEGSIFTRPCPKKACFQPFHPYEEKIRQSVRKISPSSFSNSFFLARLLRALHPLFNWIDLPGEKVVSLPQGNKGFGLLQRLFCLQQHLLGKFMFPFPSGIPPFGILPKSGKLFMMMPQRFP
jgi:hypothetical protein